MQIRDLEKKTGLERATIRYYEREGLLTPQRLDNGYRSYSEDDVQTLLKIKLLRQLGMPLEQILSLQQGSEVLSQALERHIVFLERQIRHNERSREICREIRMATSEYRELDAPYYLEKLNHPESQNAPWQASIKKPFQEIIPREYHPVRRFAARMVDYTLLKSLLKFAVIVLLRIRPFGTLLNWLVYFGALFLLTVVEAFCLSRWGSSPGKWAMGLAVYSCNGGCLSFSQALEREWSVLRDGLGYGIPGLRVWRIRKQYKEYQSAPDPDWDWESEYIYKEQKIWHSAVFVAMVCVSIGLILISALDSVRPRYRGENLTVEQFASNYNFYVNLLSENVASQELLQEDGRPYPAANNIIYVGGQPEQTAAGFSYEIENGFLKKITYTNRWTEVGYCPAIPGRCVMAAHTILLSQKNVSLTDWKAFARHWDEEMKAGETEGSLSWGNVELRWCYHLENCRFVNSGQVCTAIDSEAESSMAIQFEIIIHNG